MNENAKNETTIDTIDEGMFHDRIYEIRGQKVMLDFELAEIYGYTTKRFNEQVKNNIEKFDEDFRFRLTDEEWKAARVQIENARQETATGLRSKKSTSSWGGTRYLPYAFTEQGIYMLMTVLKGERATQQSKALIRLFKRMKDHIIENQGLVGRREFLLLSAHVSNSLRDIMGMRRSIDEIGDELAGVVDELADTVKRSELSPVMLDFGNPTVRRGYFLLDGSPVEANEAYAEIYGDARKSVFVIDNYIGMKTLVLLKNVPPSVPITIFSDNKGRGLHACELADFRREYPGIEVQLREAGGIFHDRYVVIDFGYKTEKIYHCGASSKDAGDKATTISEVPEREAYRELISSLQNNAELALPT